MFSKRIKALEESEAQCKKEIAELKALLEQHNKELETMSRQNEERVNFAQVVDEWLNGGKDDGKE